MTDKKKKKVLLLGWDAADWKVINPLMDQGLMPNLQKLVDGGVIGNLATLDPAYSPMLWTSIATGKRPYKHGVLGFSEPHPNGKDIRPVMSISRKCRAIWNMLTLKGMKSHVVGWWPSHPAEPINGISISNFFQNHKGSINDPWPMAEGTVHPKEKADFFAQFRVHPEELTGEHIVPFVPDAAKVDQRKDRGIFGVAKVTAHAASLHAAFTNIIRTQEWDFAALYLDAIDHYCHGFMKFHPPKRAHIPQNKYDLYKDVVVGGYRYHDMMLGRIMELIDEDTNIVLISDHGFQPDDLRPRDIPKEPAGPAYEHSQYGIICMKGPDIKKDKIIYGANLLDITPTLLHMFGLPVGEDMDGKILLNAFNDASEPSFIPSWETIQGNDGMHKNHEEIINEEMAEKALNQLVELGYIDKPKDNKEQSYKQTFNECQFNLSRAYIDGGLMNEAIPILQTLFEENKKVSRYAFRLASCYQSVGKLTEAREIVDHLREMAVYDKPVLDVMEGSLLLGENKPLKALKLFKSAEENVNHFHSRLNMQIARCYLKVNRYSDAERALKKEIEIDYDFSNAHLLLGRVYLRQKFYEKAAESCLNSIGLEYNDPIGHYILGEALYNMGKYKQAAEALEISLSLFSDNNKARKLLSEIYQNNLNDNVKAAHHRNLFTSKIKGTIYIVSGLPRSGTSMMMQMLEKGGLNVFTDKKRTADDNNPKGYYEHEAIKGLAKNKKWIVDAEGKVMKVITQLLPALPPIFNYKIIYMERNIHEVVASQRKMLNRLGKKTKDNIMPLELINVFEKQVKEARRWAESNSNVSIKYINYLNVIKNPFEQAVIVSDFLDQKIAPEQMVQAVDAKLYREKIL